MLVQSKTRVLIVDDSAVVRKLIGDRLRKEPDIEVVGGAADPYIAREQILLHKPDLLTLDIEMPRMDGLTFLKKLMAAHPLPVIIVSSVGQAGSAASIEALRSGAVEVIAKPDGPHSVGQVTDRIVKTIRGLAGSGVARFRYVAPQAVTTAAVKAPIQPSRAPRNGLLVIGASTGGTQAIEAVLSRMPADGPPILIVQHMPPHFTTAFAQRLNQLSAMRVVEAASDMLIERGTAYIAPGDYHMTVNRIGLQLRVALNQGPAEHYQRPAVDVLFRSVALLKGTPIVAAILTGMGSDGADGLLALRRAGAETIAEDEQSCVVFGMPKVAIYRGAAMHVATLLKMPSTFAECFDRLSPRAVA
jgi:two-component system chemotaxis response regulator CheB